jgi:formate/nitrite transporter
MDNVRPAEMIGEMLAVAQTKAKLPIRDLLLRGALAGAFLGFATSLALVVTSQGLPPIVGAAFFPVGFVMLVLLGLELATGNFALLPPALLARGIGWRQLLANWFWVYLGNLAGSIAYAYLFYLAITNCGANNGGALGDLVRQIAQKKTLAYAALGPGGWTTAFVKGVLCNWMVTVGVLLALISRSTIGKIAAMWLPITTFFAQGYEHSVVNMFVIPAGKFLGAPVSTGSWWFWNQIPVTLGNILAGALLTGLAMYVTFVPRRALALEVVKPIAAREQSPATLVTAEQME